MYTRNEDMKKWNTLRNEDRLKTLLLFGLNFSQHLRPTVLAVRIAMLLKTTDPIHLNTVWQWRIEPSLEFNAAAEKDGELVN